MNSKQNIPLLLLLCSVPSLAQTEQPRRDGVKAHVSVTAIDLDASATKDGRPVPDLRADEMTLEIDGRRVLLDYFTAVETGLLNVVTSQTATFWARAGS